ncbi:type 1 phosphatases regulator YPI1 [Amanita rubescens]|nr:type 1 phosphatases regulator YPI1 [Amanita rubescens]
MANVHHPPTTANPATILRTATPSDASRTITLTAPDTDPEGGDGTLRLRGSPSPARGPRVAWGEDVVDNEGCGRKSSKVCCIYHKQRKFDESESEDSSDSDSSSDEGEGEGGEKGGEDDGSRHNHHHHHQHAHRHKPKEEKNAYERMPRAREKGKTQGVNQA